LQQHSTQLSLFVLLILAFGYLNLPEMLRGKRLDRTIEPDHSLYSYKVNDHIPQSNPRYEIDVVRKAYEVNVHQELE
jgi:hypothetical protein